MKKTIILILAIISIFIFACSQSNTDNHNPQLAPKGVSTNTDLIKTESSNIEIESFDANYGPSTGFLAKPKKDGKYPAVVIMHEWWGINDNIKQMARELAKEGYAVLAVDLYGGKIANNSDDAMKFMGEANSNTQRAVANMKSAVSFLKAQKFANSNRIASLGWCFGGGMSLQLSLNEKLNATVIYYGFLTNDKEKLKFITWPVLGIFGGKDANIPPESVKKFETALNELEIKNEINIYPNAGHAFANPSGANYAPNETKDAWEKTLAFLDKNLKK